MRLCQIRSRDLLVLVLSFWKKFCAILWVTILQFLFELGLSTCQVYVWSKPISKPASTILVIFVIYEGRSTRDFLDKQALLKQFLGNIYILKNSVPASACRQCAEVWFPERLLEIKLSPGRNVCPVMFGIQQKGMSYINIQSPPKSQILECVLFPLASMVYLFRFCHDAHDYHPSVSTSYFLILDTQTFAVKLLLDNGKLRS